MIGRALTPEAKRAVVKRILRAWLAKPDLRLGQLLVSSCERATPPLPLFAAEDEALAGVVERAACPPPHDLTPSEVALATMLNAWETWPGDLDHHRETLCGIGRLLEEHALVAEGEPSDDGRDLLAAARKAGVL